MSSTAFSPVREGMQPEELVQAAWQTYRNPAPISYDRALLGSSYNGVSERSNHMMPNRQHLSPRIKNHPTRILRPPLNKSHHSYPSPKRSYQAFEETHYGEVVPELYDVFPDTENHPKPTIQPNHRLLSFRQAQKRHTILDQYGRAGSMEIAAQIHGMFFLSEIATNSGEAINLQPELTCYRRNLFQISGSVAGPVGPVSVLTKHGQTVPIVAQEISICATESVDGHSIRLIVIPWKTPPPNSPEVPTNQEQEPPPISLIYHNEKTQDANDDVTVHPIAWRRLQFRVATANNGRRKELQQHFVLRLNLIATLVDNTRLCIAEAATAPIVVRGRSPRNFQTRKEIPLVGSSASPRGQTAQSSPRDEKVLPETLQTQKPQTLDPSKRPLQFHANNSTQSPLLLRQENLNQWSMPQQLEQAVDTISSTYTPPQGIPQEYLHKGYSSSEASHIETSAISQSQPPVAEDLIRPQFYQMGSTPTSSAMAMQPMDDNPRPAKSARYALLSDVSTLPIYHHFDERVPSYPALTQNEDLVQLSRECFPTSIGSEAWSTAESGNVLYSTSNPPPSQLHFTFSSQPFIRDEPLPGHYTWSAA